MLVMADENYPGPAILRAGRPVPPSLLARVQAGGMSREEAKELLGCFWFHCNTAYDAQVRTGTTA